MKEVRYQAAEDLITLAEAATLRGVSKSAIHELVKRGRLQSVNRYGRVLVIREEVAQFVPDRPGRKPKKK